MTPEIEFLFDFASPNVYLAYRALTPILERTGAKLVITPVLLGGIFKATGNKSPFEAYTPIKGKFEYEMLELRRFVAAHKLRRYRLNPHFPVNTLMLMRAFVAARHAGAGATFLEMGLRDMWEDGLNLADAEVLAGAIKAAGMDAPALMAAAQTDAVKKELADATAAAVARGVFGLPTFFIGDEMFFGKERLPQVEQAVDETKTED